jgi:hypothetical protein
LIKEEWMKAMLNWDLFTHPNTEIFSKSISHKEKLALSTDWKEYMTKNNVWISFYEWKTQQQILFSFHKRSTALKSSYTPALCPLPVTLVSCPVQTISISNLGREIGNLKKEIKAQTEQEGQGTEQERKVTKILTIHHQKFHVLLDIKIKGKLFKLKTLLDTGLTSTF